jgi:acetyl-CoA acetyltransferase
VNAVIAGVGIHPFGRFPVGYRELGEHAVRECLKDAAVTPDEIDMTFVANVGAELA